MPIKPENQHRYPDDWTVVRGRILERAEHRCEECRVGNHWRGYRLPDGTFVLTGFNQRLARVWPPLWEIQPHPRCERELEIVLTVAHLDHQPENCAEENLRALCQRCHLAYDLLHHLRTAYETRRRGRAIADLFGECAS